MRKSDAINKIQSLCDSNWLEKFIPVFDKLEEMIKKKDKKIYDI